MTGMKKERKQQQQATRAAKKASGNSGDGTTSLQAETDRGKDNKGKDSQVKANKDSKRKESSKKNESKMKHNGQSEVSSGDGGDGGGDGGGVLSRWMVGGAVTSVILTVYMTTLHPSLPGGDAGELITAASEVGVAHPPGYPLFTVLMKVCFLMLPSGSVAWKANLATAIMAAAAGCFLYQAVLLLSGSMAAGLFVAGMFAFSRLTWAWSVTAEVFALNNLLVAALLLTAAHFSLQRSQDTNKISQLGAFVCGLCLSNQHTTVIYIAVIVPWVLYTLYSQRALSVGLMVRLSVCFVLGLLPYVYLPLSSAYSQARWTWGDQTTLTGLLTHLLRREYGTMHLLKDHEGQGFVAGLLAYMKHVGKDLTPMTLFFFISAILSVHKRWHQGQRVILMVLMTMLAAYTAFFAWRANLDIEKPLYMAVVERFWLQSDLLVVVLAGVAFSDIMSLINSLLPVLQYHVDKLLAVTLVALQIAVNLSVCDQSGNRVVEDFALTTLRAFPPDSLVLTKGDLPSNSLRYYHLVEGIRPDITLFDQEVMTYEWSVPKLGPHARGMQWPGHRLHLTSGVSSQGLRHFTFRQLLDAQHHRKPIFACIGVQDHEPSWQAGYDLRPFGVCMQFVKKGASPPLSDWLTASRQFALNWSHPVPDSESTWEEIASAEMWRAKTVAGLHLLETADSVHSDQEKAAVLRHAYKIYNEAMESHRNFPSYWHKNFALVCEKLRHVADPSEAVHLIRVTIVHFRAYLESGTPDPQSDAIKDAIIKLQDYLDFVTKKDQQHRHKPATDHR